MPPDFEVRQAQRVSFGERRQLRPLDLPHRQMALALAPKFDRSRGLQHGTRRHVIEQRLGALVNRRIRGSYENGREEPKTGINLSRHSDTSGSATAHLS